MPMHDEEKTFPAFSVHFLSNATTLELRAPENFRTVHFDRLIAMLDDSLVAQLTAAASAPNTSSADQEYMVVPTSTYKDRGFSSPTDDDFVIKVRFETFKEIDAFARRAIARARDTGAVDEVVWRQRVLYCRIEWEKDICL